MLLILRVICSQVTRIQQFFLFIIFMNKSKFLRKFELNRLITHLQEIQLLCINISLYLLRSKIYFIWCHHIHDLHDVKSLQSFISVIESCKNSIIANKWSSNIHFLNVLIFEDECFSSRRWWLSEFNVIHHSIFTRIKMINCLKKDEKKSDLSKR